MEQIYPSQSGPVYSALVFVEGGSDKAQTRRKYVFTDQIDQLIREIYLNHRGAKTGFGKRPFLKARSPPSAIQNGTQEALA